MKVVFFLLFEYEKNWILLFLYLAFFAQRYILEDLST